MLDFKAKMRQIQFRTPLGELTMLPRPLAGLNGAYSSREKWRKGREREVGEGKVGGRRKGRDRAPSYC